MSDQIAELRERRSALRGKLQLIDRALKGQPLAPIDAAARHRETMIRRSRAAHAAAAEIGELPAVADPERREACRLDLHRFIETYQAAVAAGERKPFGAKQVEAIQRIQRCVLSGGRFLNALPRGFVKSTIGEAAVLWAVLYGHRRFAAFFGAGAEDASQAIESIKRELQENDDLAADFPEVCHAVRALEGKPQRCHSQTHSGALTHIEWTADTIVLPTILIPRGWGTPDAKLDPADLVPSPASGAIIKMKGLLGSSRGMRFKRPDGEQVRPDFVLIDDPQTDESAISPTQVLKRLSTIVKTILRLGGHGRAVAAVMNATVIAEGDLIDQLADPKQHPEWQAIRVAMMPTVPAKLEELWLGKYAELRRTYDRDDPDDQARAHCDATAFYAARRDAMDAGAEVSWPDIPLEPGEISAIQHAMNILVDDGEDVFACECQNQPKRRSDAVSLIAPDDVIAAKRSGKKPGAVPEWAAHVVFFIDVHDRVLYYTVAAVGSDFRGSIIDYGTYPKQPRKGFTNARVKRTLADLHPGLSPEATIVAGLHTLTGDLCSRAWKTPDGVALSVSLGLVDIGYKPDAVATAIARSPHRAILLGSRGLGFTPEQKPMTEYDTSPTRVRRAGPSPSAPRWIIPRQTRDGLQFVQADVSFWKEFLHARLNVPSGGDAEWTLYGDSTVDHAHFASHLTSQEPIPTTARGRTVNVWRLRPTREDHWLDCSVGCVVAASVAGCRLAATESPVRRRVARRRPRGIRHLHKPR